MRRCLNPVTTGRPSDLRAWVRLAQAHGFAGVEFGAGELSRLVAAEGIDAARQLQRETGVALATFGLPGDWQGSDDTTFRQAVSELDHLAAVAAAAGCARAGTWVRPTVPDGAVPAAWALRVVTRLRACCEVLGRHGIQLAIEWVGTPSLRVGRVPFLWTAAHTVALCDAIGLSNAGLLLDSWHWHMTGAAEADMELVPASRIVHVHINDAPDIPLADQLDNRRLLPGASGVIDVAGLLRKLAAKGYEGFVAIETFWEESARLGPEAATAAAAQAFRDVLQGCQPEEA